MVRGYDTAEVFREDLLERVRRIEEKIREPQRKITELAREAEATEARIAQRKRRFSPKRGGVWLDPKVS